MADVTVTLTAEEAQLLRAMKKAEDAQQKYNEKLRKSKEEAANASAQARKTGDSFSEMGKRAEQGFNVQTLKNYVAGFATVTTAISAVTAMWVKYKAEQDAALGSLLGTANADRMLTQVAEAGQLSTLIAQADTLATTRGMDRNAARNLLFSAISDGFQADVGSVAAASSVIDPNEAAIVAGQTRGLFRNDNLTANEALSMTLTGAKISRLDFGPMARALPQAAEGAAQIESTASETIATLAILAGAFKSGDTAADRIKGFASKAALDSRTRGRGLLAAFDTVAAMTEEERAAFLGESQELNAAFTVIRNNRDTIEKTRQDIEADRQATAQGGGLLRQRITETEQTPQFQARLQIANARNRLEIAREQSAAIEGATAQATVADAAAAQFQTGANIVERTVGDFIAPGLAGVGADSAQINAISTGIVNSVLGPAWTSSGVNRINKLLEKAGDSAERMAKSLETAAQQSSINAARAAAAQGTKP
jgi:hypothetical protein